MGVVGLRRPFRFAHRIGEDGDLPLESLWCWMSCCPSGPGLACPRERITDLGPDASLPIDPAEFQTMGRATPFAGETVFAAAKPPS